tara:strand:+ start:840 stop:1979 length:1140 start_codon:yes stop_codon:yes gene_type:complete
VQDLATMNNLAEGPLLDVLRRRYYNDLIYTFVGDILVSFNPYVIIPGIYDIPEDSIAPAVIAGHSKAVREEPHVFTVAERTYCDMMLSGKDQSLIVSGESGAGKTEACKRVMTYLTALSREKSKVQRQNATSEEKQMGVENIEEKVLRCNPFLEAFGNAKTNRNDNSSRFGKFLRLEFYHGRIIGASMKHYLLEKSRIVEPGPGERSYHIFYFLLRGATAEQKKEMGLKDISEYRYLNQSGCDTVPHMDDVAEFHDVCDALSTVGVTPEEMEDVWHGLSAVMSLGNIELNGDIEDEDSEASISESSSETMELVNHMLKADISTWLCRRSVGGGRGSVVIKTMNVLKSKDARDALAKAIYNKIFDWLVKKVNESLYVGDR